MPIGLACNCRAQLGLEISAFYSVLLRKYKGKRNLLGLIKLEAFTDNAVVLLHRTRLEAEHMLMEQQLQETAGELQEAERNLDVRKLGHQASLQRRKSFVETVVADVAEHGPEAPAVMRPGSAPLSKDKLSGSVVMPSGGLVSFDSIRRDFGSMMQVSEEPILFEIDVALTSLRDLICLYPARPPCCFRNPMSILSMFIVNIGLAMGKFQGPHDHR